MTDIKPWILPVQHGDAVVVSGGRIGMVSIVSVGLITVQFGAGGPFKDFSVKSLRWATRSEVEEAGLEGVGGLNVRV